MEILRTTVPAEMLKIIFRELSSYQLIPCRAVCRLWRDVIHDILKRDPPPILEQAIVERDYYYIATLPKPDDCLRARNCCTFMLLNTGCIDYRGWDLGYEEMSVMPFYQALIYNIRFKNIKVIDNLIPRRPCVLTKEQFSRFANIVIHSINPAKDIELFDFIMLNIYPECTPEGCQFKFEHWLYHTLVINSIELTKHIIAKEIDISHPSSMLIDAAISNDNLPMFVYLVQNGLGIVNCFDTVVSKCITSGRNKILGYLDPGRL